jgi:hypothetical protein
MVICYSKSQILQLIESYLSLFKSQWGEDGDLYSEETQRRIFNYEKIILAAFGLPLNSDCYLFLFDRATFCVKHHYSLQWIYRQLSMEADSYFRDNHVRLTDKKTLHENPFLVLPEWGVPVNSYTIFLYGQMLHNYTSRETVWKEFNILKKTNKITEIYLLCFNPDYHKNPAFHKLIEEGLSLLPAYLKWYHHRRKG